MLFTSPVYSQASGSIAGITYGHGRSGMYTRARVTPTNPDSERQRTVRHAVATLMPYWGQELDAGQRSAWNLYAANVPWTNALGQTIFLTGHQHFLRCNAPRIQAAIAIVEEAPKIYDLGTFTAPTIASLVDTPLISINFDNTDDWATAVGGHMLVWAGKSIGPGRTFYRGPWRYAGRVNGAVEPPASMQSFPAPWPYALLNIAWIKCRIIQVDGRLSMPIVLGPATIETY